VDAVVDAILHAVQNVILETFGQCATVREISSLPDNFSFLMVYNQVAREKLHLVELQLFQLRLMSQEAR
jgi:hypothetical protein